ncbi:hypothetical protein GJ496_006432 [Pomphorhynchus laevis]|nr:hypothetical protein GJ496_006432 [Pomphorhynchus laevis]
MNHNTRDKEIQCWQKGMHFEDKTAKDCQKFPTYASMDEVRKFMLYTRSEIEYICKQLWWDYDEDLRFCVAPQYDRFTSNIVAKIAVEDPKLKNATIISAKIADNVHNKNLLSCLKVGMDYNSLSSTCEFLEIDLLDRTVLENIERVLKVKSNKMQIWKPICEQFGLEYDDSLTMCVSNKVTSGELTKVQITNPYMGSNTDNYEKHLYCAIKGYYYEKMLQSCLDYKSFNVKGRQNYQKYQSIFTHAKQVYCSEYGMIYVPKVDICVRSILIKRKRVKRHVLMCETRDCGHDKVSSAIYGPNMYLLTSKNDKECFKYGFHYQRGYDGCEYFKRNIIGSSSNRTSSHNQETSLVMAYRLRYLPLVHQMLRSHCYDNNLEYNRRLRICVALGQYHGVSEYKIESSKRNDYTRFELHQFRSCIKDGMEYDHIKEECRLYVTTNLNKDDLIYYKRHSVQQLKLICAMERKQYDKELGFCPQSPKQLNALKSSKQRDKLQSLKTRLITSFCQKEDQTYNSLLKVCVKKFDSKSGFRKITHQQPFKAYCTSKGMHYDQQIDACINPLHGTITQNMTIYGIEQWKSICTLHNLHYDEDLGFCVIRRKWYETITPPIPRFDKNYISVSDKHRACLKSGMMYDSRQDLNACVHFPSKMDFHQSLNITGTLRPHIRYFMDQFCKVSSLQYDPIYDGCVFRQKSGANNDNNVYYIHRRGYTVPLIEEDKNYCYLKGMILRYVNKAKKLACVPVPTERDRRAGLRSEYARYRRMFITNRCPLYSTYSYQIEFCVRRPPQMFDMFWLQWNHSFALARNPIFNYTRFEKIKKVRNEFEKPIINCCFYRGLNYNKDQIMCMNYRTRPTANELRNYKNDYADNRKSSHNKYCDSIKMSLHPVLDVCMTTDQF